MSESALALALPLVVEHAGRVLLLAPPDTLEVIARVEEHLERHARRRLARSARWLSAVELTEQAGRLAADVERGVYAYGSESYGRALKAPDHQRALVLAMLRFHEPTAPASLAAALCADHAALAELAEQLGGTPAPGSFVPAGPPPEPADVWAVKEIAGYLSGEPFLLPPSEIRGVTYAQFVAVHNHRRDDKGRIDRDSEGRNFRGHVPELIPTSRAGFYRWWHNRCLPDRFIEPKWREYQAQRRRMQEGQAAENPELRRGEMIPAPEM